MGLRVLHVDEDYVEFPLVEGGAMARAVAWPGTGAITGSLHYVAYEAGQSSKPHLHPASQDIFYIVEGEGAMIEYLDGRPISTTPMRPGSVIVVDPGTVHQVRADTRLVNVGGPCPADLFLYRDLGIDWNLSKPPATPS